MKKRKRPSGEPPAGDGAERRARKPRRSPAEVASIRIGELLDRARGGDPAANEELFVALYDTLRGYARAAMRRQSPAHTLSATALVNEAYLRLVRHEGSWEGRGHFLGTAARAMRSILVDHARRKTRRKRRRTGTREPEEILVSCEMPPEDLLALDDALRRLAEIDPRAAKVVELRYFGGLSLPDVAKLLDVPLRTIERDWQFARTWLAAELA